MDLHAFQRGERVKHPLRQRRQVVSLKVAGIIEGAARTEAEENKSRCQTLLEGPTSPPLS